MYETWPNNVIWLEYCRWVILFSCWVDIFLFRLLSSTRTYTLKRGKKQQRRNEMRLFVFVFCRWYFSFGTFKLHNDSITEGKQKQQCFYMCKTHKWATLIMLLQFVICVMFTYFILAYCRFAIVNRHLVSANSCGRNTMWTWPRFEQYSVHIWAEWKMKCDTEHR